MFSCHSCCRSSSEPAVPWFFSPIPLGHQRGFPGTKPALGATATPGEETVLSREGPFAPRLCLCPLVSTAANEHWPSLTGARPGWGLHPSHATHSTQTTGRHRWGHPGDVVTPSCPWPGSIPVLFPFSVSPKASRGVRAL